MALEFCLNHDSKCVLTLDAFFPSASVFRMAGSVWSVATRQPLVSLIVRAKKNYVAYYEAKQKKGSKGRPRKYGMKVYLAEVFDHTHLFEKAQCPVYGRMEDIFILAENLLWKPTGDLVRFIFAVTSRGPIVLMCSDLGMDPLTAVRLYCARTSLP